MLSGILFVLYTGIPWEFLPLRSGLAIWNHLPNGHHASHTVVGKVILEPCGGPGVRRRKTQMRFARRSVKLTL